MKTDTNTFLTPGGNPLKRLPSNWRQRIELTRHDDPVVYSGHGGRILEAMTTFKLSFKKGRTPRGFGRFIGDLMVDRSSCFVAEASQDKHFCKRGLGTLLYTHALEQFGSLTTFFHDASPAAQGLWKSLVRRYPHKTDFFKGTVTIFLERTTENCSKVE